ncbi:phage tail assembly protein [Kordiimonas marina]|uniref:phage tail assembly protein n=1 Tax=Kordiimonas marina TaxID=2872312 RepID=UPI001FF44E79|nr:phage tail assembly protein [Kordiimonas marina]MCJ9428538.1 phage tail assembly protein [Kordiimonas marina]
MSDKITIKLSEPVTVDQVKYSELKMRRRMVARDQVLVGHLHANPAAQEAHMIANLCEVDPEVIMNLGMPDYQRAQEALIKASTASGEQDPKP